MRTVFLALLLAAVFALFVPSLQNWMRAALSARPALVWLLPFLLAAIFSAASSIAGAFSVRLSLLVLGYTAVPTLCAFLAGPPRLRASASKKAPHLLDFLVILLLWFPLEFAAGQALVPRPAQGFLHSVAYGIAILLALVLFLCFRQIPGMKYNLPASRRDLWLPLAAFAVTAPVLAILGVAIGFIPPFHLPAQSAGRMASAAGLIFAGTALPEEILFRSLIQNLLMLRFGSNLRILLLSSFIFGCAHLDNGPQAIPNWRYMILATVAGIAYGKVFVSGSTVFSSAALHTLVDWTKHFFF